MCEAQEKPNPEKGSVLARALPMGGARGKTYAPGFPKSFYGSDGAGSLTTLTAHALRVTSNHCNLVSPWHA